MERLIKYQIDKIKYGKDKKVRIEYSLKENEYSISSVEPPQPELLLALWELASDLNDICELGIDEDQVMNFIQIIGVSFTDSEMGMGSTITGLKKLRVCNAPLVLNSPHLFSHAETEEQMLPAGTYGKLKILAHEANRYIGGVRGDGYQLELFPEEDKELEREKAAIL